jgi:hypothetical protein
MRDTGTIYSCPKCRIHLHEASAAALCEIEEGQFLCIACDQPMPQESKSPE